MAVLKGAAATHLRGVVRTDIHVHGAATGRMTTTGTESYQMNLLNVPRKLRGLLMAPEGMVLVSLDYAAAEIRIAASLSGERGLIDLLSSGVDPYLWLGVKRFGQEAVDADPDIRDKLKKALVSTLYGSGTRSLAAALGVDEKAAKGLTDALRSEWPTLFAFIARVSQEAAAGVRPVSGGGRPLPMTVEGKDYTRMNHLCQSTGADYLYAGLELVAERLGRDSIFLCVHDEVVVAVRPEQAQYAALVLKECMTFELPNGVMLTGEASVGGRSWSK
jgi:DNA polymerase-1